MARFRMELGRLFVAMAAGGVGVATAPSLLAQDAGPVVALKTPAFQIPYTIDARGKRPAKVQLWVSIDRGQNWQLHGTESLDNKLFDFRAAAEGEYWFLVQSVDESGTAFPSNAKPMRVLVDTTKPRAEIVADYSVEGDLIVDLSVIESHLAPETAVLRYRTDQDDQWHDVELNLGDAEEGRLVDTIRVPVPACREIGLVFQIQDKAGNAGQTTFKYEVPRTAGLVPDMTLASTSDQNGKFVSIPGATSWDPVSEQTKRKLAARQRAALPQESQSPVGQHPATQPRAASQQHSPALHAGENMQENPGRLAGNSSANEFSSPYGGVSSGLVLEPSTPMAEELPAPKPEGAESPRYTTTYEAPATPSNAASRRPPPSSPELQGGTPGTFRTPSAIDLPASELSGSDFSANAHTTDATPDRADIELRDQLTRPQNDTVPRNIAVDAPRSDASLDAFQCNSRAFSLDYAVESLGGSSLSTVQLWGTEDAGASWQQWGEDPDRVSPFDVKVGNDGLFGFRMVVVSANGLVSNKPRPGDKADVWIQVDTSVPTVQISRAVYGIGQLEGKLVVDFSCTDNQLLRQPAALYYRTNKAEKWRLIEQNLDANDTYAWKPPLDLPDHIYLKVQAVDQAGNIGNHELDKPINVKGLAPRGRIHRVRPIR